MSNITKSFAQLVKYNNGFFKSDKQAEFLTGQLDQDNCYIGSAVQVYSSSARQVYVCDDEGVVQVIKITQNQNTVVWERDTTDNWKLRNEVRQLSKDTAKWINKATEVRNRCKEVIFAQVEKSSADPVVLASMARRYKALEAAITKMLANQETLTARLHQ